MVTTWTETDRSCTRIFSPGPWARQPPWLFTCHNGLQDSAHIYNITIKFRPGHTGRLPLSANFQACQFYILHELYFVISFSTLSNVVGKTRQRTVRYGVWIPKGARHLSPLRTFRPALGPTKPPIQWVPLLFPGGKAAGAWCWPFASI